jgi:CDP-2,3-bis-(O-geranylgeranyl)-sn-glycerol synthase
MVIKILKDFVIAFILYLPAMAANGTPVVLRRFVKNAHPIDFNATFRDGRPLLGQGKTWEGFLGGFVIGATLGVLVHPLIPKYSFTLVTLYMPLGALLGDIAGSFIKRRLGVKRGDPLPILDQLDFYIGSTLAMIACREYPSLISIVLMAIVIYVLHRATNLLAYKIGLKDVPW